jgi:hypothetical protein
MSGDMDGKSRDGTWEALIGPLEAQYITWEQRGEEPSYKETKERGASEGGGWCRSTEDGCARERIRREGHLLKGSF